MPEKPATPMADRISAPTPVEITGGMTAMMKAIDFSIRDHLDRGGQVEMLAGWSREPISLCIVYPQTYHLGSKVRVCVDWLGQRGCRNRGIARHV